MCGIAGIFHFDGRTPSPQLTARMRSVMSHRGPDDEGEYFDGPVALAVRRLSIIDLSPTGHQPMCNEEGSVWICFNGEIYNYVELIPQLKAKGHRFHSHTDTEVILHAYEDWGPQCIDFLNGMFAFAIWDCRAQQLFIARDRMGVKPLYYTLHNNTFLFSSEIKAILQDVTVPRRPNLTAIHEYLQYEYNLDDGTFFDGIKKLMPGHYMIVRREGVSIQKYWEIPPVNHEEGARSEQEYIERCFELLQDAVRIRLRSEVPLGFSLSGGLDSSSVLGLASRMLSRTPLTFSGAFAEDPRYDERPYIHTMVNLLGTEHHEIVPHFRDFLMELENIIWFMDEPVVGPGVFSQLAVSRLCSKHVKVVLGGLGGDELFGGYQRYTISYLRDYQYNLLRGKQPIDLAEWFRMATNLKSKVQYIGLQNTWAKIVRHLKRGSDSWFTQDALALVKNDGHREPIVDGDRLHQEMLWDMRYFLPGLLHVEDRVSMAVSLESRTPFLDYRLVEFAARVPSILQLRNLTTKYLVRQAMRNVLPAKIVNRRDKCGFPTPLDIWFRRELKDWLYEMLISSPRFRQRGLFDHSKIARLYNEHQNGRDNSIGLWSLLCTEMWFQVFLDQPMRSAFLPETRKEMA